ncbi:MAG: beta-ketoacyl-[acyl-carrier-protein] synthase II [Planctomycetes bacterium]|nr:beta-ketoacyl-[acyl-carrier-protein] synthase II [Planctomycetota bacterium]NOG54711.1 beta-ketoacyl-ACP synthase II [Planctomycetota bacterium]
MNKRRVVVTGVGGLCNLGHTREAIWAEMKAGRPNMQLIPEYQGEQWAVKFGAPVANWDPGDRLDHAQTKRLDRFGTFAMYAATEAVEDSGLQFDKEDPYRCGVVIGSGVGGVGTIEEYLRKLDSKGPSRVTPFLVPRLMVNAASGNISILYGLKGPNSAPATACASAANAIGDAFQLIQDGDAEIMVAGGSEAAMTPICVAGFMVMKALSTRNDDPNRASRPFDRDRDGFVLAEGSGIIVLEELEHATARGANIYAELLGFGSSGDANHITAPDPEGRGAAKCMVLAMRDAEINPDQIDYINAHGTSTPLGDRAEVQAIKSVFGDHAYKLTVSSTKSVTGHTLGASGGIESIAVTCAIRDQVCPPTANLENPDEGFDLDFAPIDAKERPVKLALNNSFGFGGHNVSLVFGKFEG